MLKLNSTDFIKGFKHRNTSDGLYLFNRSSGINILFDEISFPAEELSQAPRFVSIALTNACDLDCTHCYAPKYKSEIEFEILKKWLIELDVNGCMGVGFGGGEPTIYPRFIKLCRFLHDNTKMSITLTTHGHNLTLRYIDKISKYVNFVRISMDGINETYETIRGMPFSNFLDKLEKLNGRINFGINYLVNSETVGDLDAAIKIAEYYSASEFLLLPEVGVGRGKKANSYSLSKMVEIVKSYNGSIKLAVSENSTDGLPIALPFKSEVGLDAYAHLDASGKLRRNSFDQVGIEIGNNGFLSTLQQLKSMEQ